jgi:hypothetical protein
VATSASCSSPQASCVPRLGCGPNTDAIATWAAASCCIMSAAAEARETCVAGRSKHTQLDESKAPMGCIQHTHGVCERQLTPAAQAFRTWSPCQLDQGANHNHVMACTHSSNGVWFKSSACSLRGWLVTASGGQYSDLHALLPGSGLASTTDSTPSCAGATHRRRHDRRQQHHLLRQP